MTPLKNWATVVWVALGLFLFYVFYVSEYNPILYFRYGQRAKGALLLGVLVASVLAWAWTAKNLNAADRTLGNVFKKCPACFAQAISFDVKVGSLTDRVVCRSCTAEWHFTLNLLSMRISRLWLANPGQCLNQTERETTPATDVAADWESWALARFSQRREST